MCACAGVRVFTGICPDNTSVQAEIVDVHNDFRRAVQPPATDMLKMVKKKENKTKAKKTVKVREVWTHLGG